jgi:hypothetical protein
MYVWQGPVRLCLSGSASTGKTTFTYNLLFHRNQMFSCKENQPDMSILFCYSSYQDIYDKMKDQFKDRIMFHHGLPSQADIQLLTADSHKGFQSLLCLDDLFEDVCFNIKTMSKFWYETSHHKLMNIIYISHNFFSKNSRIINLNTSSLILFRTIFAANIIQTLARQIFVGKGKSLLEAYEDCMAMDMYKYPLVIDFTSTTPDLHRFRTDIFNSNNETIIYLLNNR